ncbi:HesA/MoeB/ThiF family protein [Clostridium sp. Cult2]|uniref:HesA/MoeB/ThiF family protein n=1 Tax=Clostridium sp. Cult2 TaxID=2079003 RepID=UPI001F24B5A8|nr:HesA/MoeB/ThiF family protein [Clostridium sp. Cult2]MCF6466292.1 molybdopterin biosynthesis protein MoeB [Clostridium sp. Cult2]
MKRYLRNMKALSAEEIKLLNKSKVCVVGCGGLGGYIVEMLGRIGVGFITVIDGDIFDETNLNRQLVCHTKNIGLSKSEETKKRMELVNPHILVKALNIMIDESNSKSILRGHDVIVDALDSIESRRIIQNSSAELNIPMVHGAIGGFYGQVTTIFPQDNTLNFLYPKNGRAEEGIEKKLGNPSFIPPLVASIEVAEVIKILINRGQLLRRKILFVDLLENNFDIIYLD